MSRVSKLRLFIGLIVLSTLYYFIFHDVNRSDAATRTIEMPVLLRELCQFVEEPIRGQEGEIATEFGTLRGVAIVFRHGDRSPLHGDLVSATEGKSANVGLSECTPYREVDRRSFAKYVQLLKSEHFRNFIAIPAEMNTKLRWSPSSTRCTPREMTAEGALQHLKLGNFLRKRYSRSGWLQQTKRKLDVQVIATPYSRTFQSAIAFLTSFLYPLNKYFGKIAINLSKMTHFCMNDQCKCTNVIGLHRQYETERTPFFESHFGPKGRRIFELFKYVYNLSDVTDPIHLMDIALGRHVCRRMPLPCRGGICITYDDVVKLANLVSDRDTAMFNDSSNSSSVSIMRRLVVAESVAILQSVSNMVDQLRRNESDTNLLRIFSGHDVTLRPLLFALGIAHREPPPYTSRLIFEIYEKKYSNMKQPVAKSADDKSKFFVRFIYNGVDQTRRVSFCYKKFSLAKSRKYCDGRLLKEFVNDGLFKIARASSLNQLCDD